MCFAKAWLTPEEMVLWLIITARPRITPGLKVVKNKLQRKESHSCRELHIFLLSQPRDALPSGQGRVVGVNVTNKPQWARRCWPPGTRSVLTRQTPRARAEWYTPLVNLVNICVEGISHRHPSGRRGRLHINDIAAVLSPVFSIWRVIRSPLCVSGPSLIIHRVQVWVRSYRVTPSFVPSEGGLGCCTAVTLRSACIFTCC